MNKWVFNGSMLAGLVLVGVGLGLMYGLGAGLAATGALLIGLTMYGAHAAAKA